MPSSSSRRSPLAYLNGASLAGSASAQGVTASQGSARMSWLSGARCFMAAARSTASGSLDASMPSLMAARSTTYASHRPITAAMPPAAAQNNNSLANAGVISTGAPDGVNAPSWRSIADFLTLDFLRSEFAKRRAAERSARGPACGDTRQRSSAEPVVTCLPPDGNHGEII